MIARVDLHARSQLHDDTDSAQEARGEDPHKTKVSVPCLTLTVVNVGARPVPLLAAGVMARRRGLAKQVRESRATQSGHRRLSGRLPWSKQAVFVPQLPRDTGEFDRMVLTDGESTVVSWGLDKGPFRDLKTVGLFVDEVGGKRHGLRLKRSIRREIERNTGVVFEQVGPALGGAITETCRREVPSEPWAMVGDHVFHLDRDAVLKRLAITSQFPRFEKRLTQLGIDLACPRQLVGLFDCPLEDWSLVVSSFTDLFASSGYTLGRSEPPEVPDRVLAQVKGEAIVDEPAVALFVERLNELVVACRGRVVTFGVATPDGSRLVPFAVPATARPAESAEL